VGLWALVHLIDNGDVVSLVFFVTWAIVALAGTVSIDTKRRRLLPKNRIIASPTYLSIVAP
jgi:uncharacterized membrane protein